MSVLGWPWSHDEVCVFYPIGHPCQSWSDTVDGHGWGCCMRGPHDGVHLHSSGKAWTDEDKTPRAVMLVLAPETP